MRLFNIKARDCIRICVKKKKRKKKEAHPRFPNSVVQKARGLHAAKGLKENAVLRATVKYVPKRK